MLDTHSRTRALCYPRDRQCQTGGCRRNEGFIGSAHLRIEPSWALSTVSCIYHKRAGFRENLTLGSSVNKDNLPLCACTLFGPYERSASGLAYAQDVAVRKIAPVVSL